MSLSDPYVLASLAILAGAIYYALLRRPSTPGVPASPFSAPHPVQALRDAVDSAANVHILSDLGRAQADKLKAGIAEIAKPAGGDAAPKS